MTENPSRDTPIIFSAPMIRALLNEAAESGTGKTMTRRLAWRNEKALGRIRDVGGYQKRGYALREEDGEFFGLPPSPWQKVKPGYRLWVRENFRVQQINRFCDHRGWHRSVCIDYPAAEGRAASDFRRWVEVKEADVPKALGKRRGESGKDAPITPCIHLPRVASRLTLIVTSTKIEPLQAISEQDCEREGIYDTEFYDNAERKVSAGAPWAPERLAFADLWGSLHGVESWIANPDVVAISFRVVAQNIDSMKG